MVCAEFIWVCAWLPGLCYVSLLSFQFSALSSGSDSDQTKSYLAEFEKVVEPMLTKLLVESFSRMKNPSDDNLIGELLVHKCI